MCVLPNEEEDLVVVVLVVLAAVDEPQSGHQEQLLNWHRQGYGERGGEKRKSGILPKWMIVVASSSSCCHSA